jgi:hypothetical protein
MSPHISQLAMSNILVIEVYGQEHLRPLVRVSSHPGRMRKRRCRPARLRLR